MGSLPDVPFENIQRYVQSDVTTDMLKERDLRNVNEFKRQQWEGRLGEQFNTKFNTQYRKPTKWKQEDVEEYRIRTEQDPKGKIYRGDISRRPSRDRPTDDSFKRMWARRVAKNF